MRKNNTIIYPGFLDWFYTMFSSLIFGGFIAKCVTNQPFIITPEKFIFYIAFSCLVAYVAKESE